MKKITVTAQYMGERIDKFLAKEFFLHSRGEIIRKIKDGIITVDNIKVKPSHILSSGETIYIKDDLSAEDFLKPNKLLKIDIIFENDDLLVINKPAGLQVHPSATEKENTASNWLIAHFPNTIYVHDDSSEGYLRPGIVHRLDKDTSGAMLIAKNMRTFLELKKLFSERKISKTYITLVNGNIQDASGIIDAPISRSNSHKKQVAGARKTRGVVRQAITEYTVLKRYANFTLVEAHPLTGRMHQIRVHFSHIGHPVVGDNKYKNNSFKNNKGADRQLLHAGSLSFELFGKKYSFQTPMPQDFETFLANID